MTSPATTPLSDDDRRRVSDRLRAVRAYGDLDQVAEFLGLVPLQARTYLLTHVLKTDEIRVYRHEVTAADVRAEQLAKDTRTPAAWRQWLARSRQLFSDDPWRVAEQYFFLSEPGRNVVYWALTRDERYALRQLSEKRWRDLNVAFSEQRAANRMRRAPLDQTA
ncbi:hypothetical protein [Rhodovibrio salinarum]|nr:hypothetical protein [Rhodovibrio salinarum]